jgi:galactonate dehydratase
VSQAQNRRFAAKDRHEYRASHVDRRSTPGQTFCLLYRRFAGLRRSIIVEPIDRESNGHRRTLRCGCGVLKSGVTVRDQTLIQRAALRRRDFLRLAATAGAAAVSPLGGLRARAQQERGRAPLKIRSVEAHVIRIASRSNIVCARIETEDGLHGWGEGTTPPNVAPVVAQIRSFRDLLAGQSAWDIERLWRRMYITEENTLGGTLYAAISAIDIALWDIVGKKLGVPVYQLLGGKIHDRLRIYTSYRWGNIARTADAYRARTRELIAQGATAGKYDPFGAYPGPERQLPTATLNEVREMVRGIREAGPAFDICIEAHGKFNLASAGRIVNILEPFDVFFLEEPVPPEDVDAMAALQRSTNIPIATGEGIQGHFNYRELLAKQSARIWQPDVARTGGITAMKKIVALADIGYIAIAPHNPNGPICTAASMHIATSSPNFLIMEEGNTNPEGYGDIFKDGWKQNLTEWTVPESPGLGVDLGPEFVREHEVKVDL